MTVPQVLIVDEDGCCSEGLKGPLQASGFQVFSLTNFREATQALQKAGQHYDFVILNISASPHKGLEWLRQTNAIRLERGLFPDGVLCVASPFLDPQLELDLATLGGKVVYEQPVRSGAS